MPGRIRAGIVSGHGSSWRGGHIPNNWSLRRARVGRVARGSRPKRAVCARDRKCGDEGQEDGGVHGSRLGPFPHAVDGDARPVRERGRIPVIFILSSDARGAQARIRCATRHGTFSSPRSSSDRAAPRFCTRQRAPGEAGAVDSPDGAPSMGPEMEERGLTMGVATRWAAIA
jgi:hypothetical protein